MPFYEEEQARLRILEAVREAFPARAVETGKRIDRWFAWYWRNEPAARDPWPRCVLCARMRALTGRMPGSTSVHRINVVARREREFPTGLRGLCDDCTLEARALARDPDAPLRDMLRAQVSRALTARGDDASIALLERVATRFPDLRRESAACALCARPGAAIAGAEAAVCAVCIDDVESAVPSSVRYA